MEANYTAKFAVRMTFPSYLEKFNGKDSSPNPLKFLQEMGERELSQTYQQLFPVPANHPQPGQAMVKKLLQMAQDCWDLKNHAYREMH